MYSCCGKPSAGVSRVVVSAQSLRLLRSKVIYDLDRGYLPAHPFPQPAAKAARELFSPLLTLALYLRAGGITPGWLPALPVGWAELQFGIQFGIAARLILSAEVFLPEARPEGFSVLTSEGDFFGLTFYQRRLHRSGFPFLFLCKQPRSLCRCASRQE